MSDRPCTCHLDDNPPVPCPQKFALSECRASLPQSGDTPAQLAEYLASGARLVEAFHQLPGVARAMREAACLLGKSEIHPAAPAPDALENCRLFAARYRNKEWARTILRFCKEGGATGSPLRAAPDPVAEVQTGTIRWHIDRADLPNGTKLYAHPAPVAAPDAKTVDEVMALADDLHNWQTVNNQEYPESWHQGVDDCADYLRVAIEQIVREKNEANDHAQETAVMWSQLRERCERAEQINREWTAAADRARQPAEFYEDYNEGTMRAMQALLSRAEQDAARYRWLRTRNDGDDVDPAGPYVVCDSDYPTGSEIDAAIDAALKEGK